MAAADLVAQLIEDLDPGCVVIKFAVVVEVIDAEGNRTVWRTTHDNATRWDTYGLLTEALESVRAEHYDAARTDAADD